MMTKKERAAFDAMAAELAQLRALHVEMDAPDKDVPVPSGWGAMAHGWLVSASSIHGLGGIRAAVCKVTSESHAHYRGEHIMQHDHNSSGWSQRGVASYSTRRRALLALRADVCRQHAATLATIDAEIEKEPA